MATPPRLSQIKCPNCHHLQWIIDHDFRAAFLAGGVDLGYAERAYSCGGCGNTGPGWLVRQQSPAEFLLQPHPIHPMAQEEFDYWLSILRTNFPDDWRLSGLGREFAPYHPERFAIEQAAEQARIEREHPVSQLRDQDGTEKENPTYQNAVDWLGVMRLGDTLEFILRKGGILQLLETADQVFHERFTVYCTDADGKILADATAVDSEYALSAIAQCLAGNVAECVNLILAFRAHAAGQTPQ